MKLKTTQKNIRENYFHIISIGYCDAWYLLYFQSPFAFNSGVYGWNCDYYDIHGFCICTGYRPHGKHVDFELIHQYNRKAREIIESNNILYDDKKLKVNSLLNEFISKVTQ